MARRKAPEASGSLPTPEEMLQQLPAKERRRVREFLRKREQQEREMELVPVGPGQSVPLTAAGARHFPAMKATLEDLDANDRDSLLRALNGCFGYAAPVPRPAHEFAAKTRTKLVEKNKSLSGREERAREGGRKRMSTDLNEAVLLLAAGEHPRLPRRHRNNGAIVMALRALDRQRWGAVSESRVGMIRFRYMLKGGKVVRRPRNKPPAKS
jgi:hypothetical protein